MVIDMTEDRHYYRHKSTYVTAEMSDRVASMFGDALERVEAPATAPKRAKKISPSSGGTVA